MVNRLGLEIWRDILHTCTLEDRCVIHTLFFRHDCVSYGKELVDERDEHREHLIVKRWYDCDIIVGWDNTSD